MSKPLDDRPLIQLIIALLVIYTIIGTYIGATWLVGR